MATRHVGDIDAFEPRSGSPDPGAAAVPTPRRWFAFVRVTGMIGEVISLPVPVLLDWEWGQLLLPVVWNFGIVSWHGCEVLMTMGHPGCEVIERKPSLAEAGRVLVSPGPVPRASASLRSSQHPEFRSAADLGEETFEVNGSRSGTPSL
ncbi:hypothetical protein D4764_06G0001040 [Takifugu flavidus]|uniref:Uncharacterized protein n=1 Tax=Takifugu flavidus TaxID=433684 RepID=A0A5C6MTF6_9TELE|nr:hypothetical protein D4764_06G0001040 [Takifugu flavidus]